MGIGWSSLGIPLRFVASNGGVCANGVFRIGLDLGNARMSLQIALEAGLAGLETVPVAKL